MKILHLADTHLGFSAYRKVTERGINQRELDAYSAFKEFIDYAVKTKPDLIIHAGDLFDSVRPNNRAITFAIKQILRISKAEIPMIIISGNHEQPKLKETGHIFSIFDHMTNIFPVYNEKYESFDFEISSEKIKIHTLPQSTSKDDYIKQVKAVTPDKDFEYNVFVSHGSVTGVQNYSMNEFNELIIPARSLSKDFTYIALGHFHRYTKISNNTFYAGSTERLTFTDAPDKKGFIEIDLSKKGLKTKFLELKNRPMVDVKPIKCSNLKIDEVMKKIRQTVKQIDPKQKTVRMTLDEIPSHIYRGIDFNELKKQTSNAIHFEIKANIIKEDTKEIQTSSKIDKLASEFKLFLENSELEDKKLLLEMGIGYIEKIEAINEGK
jgi:DNA repair exonuclease SbcCD nuclease subunit